jgi:S1-C subfamily serine protease
MPEDEDEGAPGLPPHPLDRVWFHPSELGGAPAETHRLSRPPQWAMLVIAAFCGVVATLGVLAATGAVGGDDGGVGSSSSFVPAFAQLQRDHAADLVSSAGASVVAVRVTTRDATTTDGSGVAVGGDRIVTSAALVGDAASASVTTDHGRVVAAKVVGSDPESDVALLQVDGVRVPPADMGSSDDLAVGTWVLAVGAAGGEDRWASQGVVSGVNQLVTLAFGTMMPGVLATDVDTPSRSGGGVLLDEDGSVVAILSRAAPGRAVPIEAVREVADQLAANGRVRHAWLGIDAVDAASRAGGGAIVQGIADGGPGQAAELHIGDVITSIGEERVADFADLVAAVAHRRPGDPVEVTVFRGDRRLRLDATLAERP